MKIRALSFYSLIIFSFSIFSFSQALAATDAQIDKIVEMLSNKDMAIRSEAVDFIHLSGDEYLQVPRVQMTIAANFIPHIDPLDDVALKLADSAVSLLVSTHHVQRDILVFVFNNTLGMKKDDSSEWLSYDRERGQHFFEMLASDDVATYDFLLNQVVSIANDPSQANNYGLVKDLGRILGSFRCFTAGQSLFDQIPRALDLLRQLPSGFDRMDFVKAIGNPFLPLSPADQDRLLKDFFAFQDEAKLDESQFAYFFLASLSPLPDRLLDQLAQATYASNPFTAQRALSIVTSNTSVQNPHSVDVLMEITRKLDPASVLMGAVYMDGWTELDISKLSFTRELIDKAVSFATAPAIAESRYPYLGFLFKAVNTTFLTRENYIALTNILTVDDTDILAREIPNGVIVPDEAMEKVLGMVKSSDPRIRASALFFLFTIGKDYLMPYTWNLESSYFLMELLPSFIQGLKLTDPKERGYFAGHLKEIYYDRLFLTLQLNQLVSLFQDEIRESLKDPNLESATQDKYLALRMFKTIDNYDCAFYRWPASDFQAAWSAFFKPYLTSNDPLEAKNAHLWTKWLSQAGGWFYSKTGCP